MANKKISELPSATEPLNDADLVEVVQGGINKKAPKSAFGGGGSGTVESVTGDGVDNTDADNPVISFPDASEVPFTPAGNLSSTDVQAALEELDAAISASINVLDSVGASTAGGTITLNMNSQVQRMFVGSASFAAAKILALSNTTNSLFFNFIFQVTDVAAVLTMPADFLMADPNFDGDDWTPAVIGIYEMGGSWNGTNWIVKISGPFV